MYMRAKDKEVFFGLGQEREGHIGGDILEVGSEGYFRVLEKSWTMNFSRDISPYIKGTTNIRTRQTSTSICLRHKALCNKRPWEANHEARNPSYKPRRPVDRGGPGKKEKG